VNLRDVEPLPSGARDLVARGVLFTLQTLELGQQAAPVRFKSRKLVQLGRHVKATFLQTSPDSLEIVPEERGIHHNSTPDQRAVPITACERGRASTAELFPDVSSQRL
jgi:hypothetical protein